MPEPFSLHALRKSDLLSLRFDFFNLEPGADGRLSRVEPGSPAMVAVQFPPQHIAERLFSIRPDGSLTPDPPAGGGDAVTPPISGVMAGGSRLVFRLPNAVHTLPLTLEGLLGWEAWLPVLSASAVPEGDIPPAGMEAPQAPDEAQTAIELPWRLVLSPDGTAHWKHDALPAEINGALQLWRTNLSAGAGLRGLAALDGDEPKLGVLSAKDRREIVRLSSDHAIPVQAGQPTYVPLPVRADQLTLSTLGATARLERRWETPLVRPGATGIDLQRYSHFVAQGRDHFARLTKIGYLAGVGHRVSVVETTERVHSSIRQAGTTPEGALFGATGYLIRRFELVVQQPEIDYGELAAAYAFGGREMPFRSVRLLTLAAQITNPPDNEPAWVMRAEAPDKPVMFKVAATDLEGNVVQFELPFVHVPLSVLGQEQTIAQVLRFPPGGSPDRNGRTADVQGDEIAFAPATDRPGSTTLHTSTFTYDIETINNVTGIGALNEAALPPWYVPRFLPAVVGAAASVPAIEEALGRSNPQAFVLDPLYLNHGFGGGNAAQSFARFTTPVDLEFASQRGGGLARPSSKAEGLSRILGPVANPVQMAAGQIDFSSFANAKFLGTVRLLDIIRPGLPFDAGEASSEPTAQELNNPGFRLNTPRLVVKRHPAGATVPDSVTTRFLWKPRLQNTSVGGVLTLELENADLLLDVRVEKSARGGGSAVTLGRLRNARLSFEGAISVRFEELRFRAEDGKKLEVNASKAELIFAGPLNFVNALQEILPDDGFDDPPFLTVDGQGVVAGYTLGVPSVGVGIFSLQNIALTAALSVPFTDRPAGVRFAVSDRHKPFLITVSLFGGGGFFAMAVSAKGLEQVEASLEFGGNISINIVIASGGVYVMAGIYFGLTGTSVTLTGYLRCGGSLEVLGLISISVEFYLGFTYRDKGNGGSEVWGQASVTFCVKIAFFSKSVSLSVERRFAGSGGDPSFADSVTPANWAEYLLAFAS